MTLKSTSAAMRFAAASVLVATTALLGGCGTYEPINPAYFNIEQGQLPTPNTTLNIAGLGPCTDNPDRSLHLDASKPVHVLVHGCFGSSGQFRGLAQVLAFHGQQTACYTYDDRARLSKVASDLQQAMGQLAAQTRAPQITLIGHSQGALIARKSMTESISQTSPVGPSSLRLVTISGPFSGIDSARTCGKSWLYPLSIGLLPLSCYIATGPKWADITFSSRFIREPGTLAPQVTDYLKIDTDERNTCRREEGGRCVEDDDIFTLAEQRQAAVETDTRTRRVEVNAGHVEIVGDKRVAPTKLISVLQEQGVLRPTPVAQLPAFRQLLARVYETAPATQQNQPKTASQP
ncbi:MAG TPA: alpha/beta hydrolase [Polaromonas sp.]|uniref:alpha/beta hydrolase n=1 Tax=Polaromonas sp. TaxID=1869339 RepID=UPI002D31BC03|nr:alpha/beta hydrolase [Polaromonas sp.]HYW58422.1 alpha/beta hydrolase [Polaromonas sp.]